MKLVLITGGAGFIGQALTLKLLSEGAKVRILDNFSRQIHNTDSLPESLLDKVELIRADVRDREAVRKALEGVNTVVHLAAETGTGQSMYEIERYFSVNVQGTAVLLDVLQNESTAQNVKSIIVASSRAVYGEGAYRCKTHGKVYPNQREKSLLISGNFDLICPDCESVLSVEPTSESAPFKPMSMYGLTKQIQEQAILLYAKTKGINAFALRYQNVYGPGQSLKNPYTGLLAVFSNLVRQGKPIEIYEDGYESRDFVYISDVVDATSQCINFDGDFCGALNVGSGIATTVIDVASKVKSHFNAKTDIKCTGVFRVGDIRHNIADISAANVILGFTPKVFFDKGLSNFLDWVETQPPEDGGAYTSSVLELDSKGLMGRSNLASGLK